MTTTKYHQGNMYVGPRAEPKAEHMIGGQKLQFLEPCSRAAAEKSLGLTRTQKRVEREIAARKAAEDQI